MVRYTQEKVNGDVSRETVVRLVAIHNCIVPRKRGGTRDKKYLVYHAY